MKTITIHYDFTDSTELSYGELLNKKVGQFTTNCLSFFSNDIEADQIHVIDSEGNILDRELLMTEGDTTYTTKHMRKSHNLCKMLIAGSFNWR